MRKSIFVRMLSVYLLIILVSFALLGGIFFTTLRNNYLDAQMDIMVENLHEINDWVNDENCEEMTDIVFYSRLIRGCMSFCKNLQIQEKNLKKRYPF